MLSLEDSFLSSVQLKKLPFRLTSKRWLGFILLNLLVVGIYGSFDIPQALEASIKDRLNLDNTQYNSFYTALAIPNIIIPLLGGHLIGKWGVRSMMASSNFLVLLGQGIISIGAHKLS